MSRILSFRRRIDEFLAELSLAERQSEEEARSLESEKVHEANVLQAQAIAQEVAEAVQQKAHRRIASVVTRCLKAVFGEDGYEFRIEFDRKRGKTEARLEFVRDGMVLDPTSESGGGMVDVAAFALRLACVILALPKRRKLLILDEPFKHVNGEEYQAKVGGMLEVLAKETGVQIVMVTDDDWLRIGKVIQL